MHGPMNVKVDLWIWHNFCIPNYSYVHYNGIKIIASVSSFSHPIISYLGLGSDISDDGHFHPIEVKDN